MAKLATEKQVKYFESLYKRYEGKMKSEQLFYGSIYDKQIENRRDFVQQTYARHMTCVKYWETASDDSKLDMTSASMCIDYMLDFLNNY